MHPNDGIIVYGNSDTRDVYSFPAELDFIRYIQKDVFEKYIGRYQYSQVKSAEIILMARMGKAYGYFVIENKELPTEDDYKVSDSSKIVYLVIESVLFENSVLLKNLDIKGYQFGKYLTIKQFEEIKFQAGNMISFKK